MDAMKTVKICSARDTIEAEILIDILKQHNIPAYKQGVGIMGIYAGNSMFGEDIFVNEKDAAKTKELVENIVQKENN